MIAHALPTDDSQDKGASIAESLYRGASKRSRSLFYVSVMAAHLVVNLINLLLVVKAPAYAVNPLVVEFSIIGFVIAFLVNEATINDAHVYSEALVKSSMFGRTTVPYRDLSTIEEGKTWYGVRSLRFRLKTGQTATLALNGFDATGVETLIGAIVKAQPDLARVTELP